jgi:hypothetical protein
LGCVNEVWLMGRLNKKYVSNMIVAIEWKARPNLDDNGWISLPNLRFIRFGEDRTGSIGPRPFLS